MCGRDRNPKTQDHLIRPKRLVALPLIDIYPRITRIVQLVGIFKIKGPEESSTYYPLRPRIPPTHLEAGVIGFSKQLVLRMRNHRTYTKFAICIHFYLIIMCLPQMPALGNIKEQEVCAILR